MKKLQYEDFLTGVETVPPLNVSKMILVEAKEYLQPSPAKVFKKVLWIHLCASVLSLTFCPQFGVGSLGGTHGMLSPIMQFGPVVCAATCGSVFFGISAILAVILLRIEELKTVYKKGIWHYSLIAVASWLFLMTLGDAESLEFTSTWIVSGTVSASLIQVLGTLAKSYRQDRAIGAQAA